MRKAIAVIVSGILLLVAMAAGIEIIKTFIVDMVVFVLGCLFVCAILFSKES